MGHPVHQNTSADRKLASGEAGGKEKMDASRPSRGDLNLLYGVEDVPPWYLCIILGFQHYLTLIGATVSIPLILAPAMCVTSDLVKTELIGTICFVTGLFTLLQSFFGTRLPIVQGGTYSLLTPTFAILSLPQFVCPQMPAPGDNFTDYNATNDTNMDDIWKIRIREIQGAIIGASCFEILIGACGLVGFLMRFIGPLAIAPMVTLIGISLFQPAANFCSGNWPIAIMTIALITIFSQYLRNVTIPYCFYSRKDKSCRKAGCKAFQLFPVILGILTSWLICYILTVTDAIAPEDQGGWGFTARTDIRASALVDAPWFRFPYPCQWGVPTFSVAAVFGMLAGTIASTLESVGDYYACARLAGAPPPPIHAINRGLLVEGIECVLAGLWGSGNGTASYTENIGAIGITKVGSRAVIITGGFITIFLGLFTKFGALFVTIPDPIIGGLFMVMFGMIAAIGVSNLQFVDLNSSRNLFIFGFSLFFGLSLPQWLAANPDSIKTGSDIADQILTVLFRTSMFVGLVVGFFLDNTIPGTMEERGIRAWQQVVVDSGRGDVLEVRDRVYDLPWCMPCVNRWRWTRYVPFCPPFRGAACGSAGAGGQPVEGSAEYGVLAGDKTGRSAQSTGGGVSTTTHF